MLPPEEFETPQGGRYSMASQADNDRYLALLARYGLPVDCFAATEVWVCAANGLWDDAEEEAAVWAYCWREYKAGRRSDFIPGGSEPVVRRLPSALS